MSTQTLKLITLTIDGQEVTVQHGTTIFDAARVSGIQIPTLCHQQNENPVAVCRVCVVDTGERALSAACVRECEPNMTVRTATEPILAARKTLYELLLSDHPRPCVREQRTHDCELEALARAAGVTEPRFGQRAHAAHANDLSSPSIAVDHSACILCDRCVRACSEVRSNFVIARQGKGYRASIAFDVDEPMGASSCVSCGECVVSCPTGALTNTAAVGQRLEAGADAGTVDVDELLALPVFKGVSGTFLERNTGAIAKRHIRASEVIFREGDYGSTAFYVLEGRVEVLLSSPRAHVTTSGNSDGFFKRLQSKLVTRTQHKREEEADRRWIPIDAPVDLAYDKPIAELGPGDLFGEMTCMNFYPRSATVRAKSDVVVLEMLRNVLDVLQKNKTFRAKLERDYRDRVLERHLRNVPIFSSLDAEFMGHLREAVELVRFSPGQVITRQGDIADSFYLVRLGFVKVAEDREGDELVLAYLSRGQYFGEMGLLTGAQRTATCTALDHVEAIRIAAEDFQAMLERFPEIRHSLELAAHERLSENRARRSQQDTSLDNFLTQGLLDAQSLLVLDLDRCTRCDLCVEACADAHDGVTRLIRDGLRFDKYLVATSCRQCRDPLCMVGCPVGAIRRKNSLEVIIEDWCVGCGLCANNCPYGNITVHEFAPQSGLVQIGSPLTGAQQHGVRKATSCNLCHDLPEPSCVYACPHDAAKRVNPSEFFASVMQQEPAKRDQAVARAASGK